MPAYVKSPKKDCADCKAGTCMAHGGEAHFSKGGVATETSSSVRRHQKGVHQSISKGDAGTSVAGGYIGGHGYGNNTETAKRLHRDKLSELKSMKGPHGNYAEGGEVEHEDSDDDEIHEMLGEELTSAMHRKDHKGVMACLNACIDNHMSKRGKK